MTPARSCALVLALTSTACGRVGFGESETASAPLLEVTQSDQMIDVLAPNRFRLVFSVFELWQVYEWYDLTYDSTLNLVGRYSSARQFQTLQAPALVRLGAEWDSLDNATTVQLPIVTVANDTVTIDTHLAWTEGGTDVTANVTHVIDFDGTWAVDVMLASNITDQIPIEFADSHVTYDRTWLESTTSASYELTVESATNGVRPRLRADKTSSLGTINQDEMFNHYWADTQSLLSPVHLAWINTIWPPVP